MAPLNRKQTMNKFAATAILVIFCIGAAVLLYVESADTPGERAARMRGCLLCHTDAFTETPLSCLPRWQHGTPLTPMVKDSMLQAHPSLPGADANTLAHYIMLQQLPLLHESRKGNRGTTLYRAKCAVCHGKNGEGYPGSYPPLAGSEWLTPSPDRPTPEDIITNGISGPISVKGEQWNATMLPPGITDAEDIRHVLEYIRSFK